MGTNGDPKNEVFTKEKALPIELQGQIGQRLREAYNELVREPVPDRFIVLLQQLKEREDGGPGGKS